MKFDKPVKRPKAARKPLRRSGRIGPRKVAGPRPTDGFIHPKPRREKKTKHGRRARALGKMAFLKSRPCDVRDALNSLIADVVLMDFEPAMSSALVLALSMIGPCEGITEVMHLGWKAESGGRRQDEDADTAPGCQRHHGESGSKLGGLGPWYVALKRDGQHALRKRLQDRAQAAWDALTPEDRAGWDARAAAELGRKGRP